MSQSSKCDEHRRLHNAKSLPLIDDTVTHAHTHIGMPTLTVSHTQTHTDIHVCVRSPAKNTVLAHTSTGRRAPLSSHSSSPGSGSPVLHAPTLSLHTLVALSLSRSVLLSHTHAPMLQHLLSQRGRRGAIE